MNTEPEVTRAHIFDMQVCVPHDWTDEQIVEFANRRNSSGTKTGWHIRRTGDPALAGDPERTPCAGSQGRPGFVHVMLDC